MALNESDERDVLLKGESWEVQRESTDRRGREDCILCLRRSEGNRLGRHGEQGCHY